MKGSLLRGRSISLLILLVFAPLASSSVVQLSSPEVFSGSATVIDFDNGIHLQFADTLYLDKGVSFSRDDGYGVFITSCPNDRSTTSSPNVLSTVRSRVSNPPIPEWATHLNADFITPVYEVGAYFGNDWGDFKFSRITLSAYGEDNSLLGSVYVDTNGNKNIDQFISLSSDEPIHSVRFENNHTWYAVEIDDLIFTQVPEPTTLVLLVFGAVLLRKRRR